MVDSGYKNKDENEVNYESPDDRQSKYYQVASPKVISITNNKHVSEHLQQHLQVEEDDYVSKASSEVSAQNLLERKRHSEQTANQLPYSNNLKQAIINGQAKLKSMRSYQNTLNNTKSSVKFKEIDGVHKRLPRTVISKIVSLSNKLKMPPVSTANRASKLIQLSPLK